MLQSFTTINEVQPCWLLLECPMLRFNITAFVTVTKRRVRNLPTSVARRKAVCLSNTRLYCSSMNNGPSRRKTLTPASSRLPLLGHMCSTLDMSCLSWKEHLENLIFFRVEQEKSDLDIFQSPIIIPKQAILIKISS